MLSFGGLKENQFEIQPMAHDAYRELYFKKAALRRENYVFAFVWFHATKHSGRVRFDTDHGVAPQRTTKLHTIESTEAELSQSLLSTHYVSV